MLNNQLEQINDLLRQSMCEHDDVETEYDVDDNRTPYVSAMYCLECGKDLIGDYTQSELDDMAQYRADELEAMRGLD